MAYPVRCPILPHEVTTVLLPSMTSQPGRSTCQTPSGLPTEAHSGFGSTKDDPRHVSQRGVGATPPAVYDLKLRERPFHGVRALRMIPVEGDTLGRSGLLAHGYMLGPDGDSHGCVSIR